MVFFPGKLREILPQMHVWIKEQLNYTGLPKKHILCRTSKDFEDNTVTVWMKDGEVKTLPNTPDIDRRFWK